VAWLQRQLVPLLSAASEADARDEREVVSLRR